MTPNEIISDRDNIALVESAVHNKSKFCDVWPQVKQGLELLQSILKDPIAKAAIGIGIAAGDAVAKNICG